MPKNKGKRRGIKAATEDVDDNDDDFDQMLAEMTAASRHPCFDSHDH
jgi:hypothetical protein